MLLQCTCMCIMLDLSSDEGPSSITQATEEQPMEVSESTGDQPPTDDQPNVKDETHITEPSSNIEPPATSDDSEKPEEKPNAVTSEPPAPEATAKEGEGDSSVQQEAEKVEKEEKIQEQPPPPSTTSNVEGETTEQVEEMDTTPQGWLGKRRMGMHHYIIMHVGEGHASLRTTGSLILEFVCVALPLFYDSCFALHYM